MIKPAKKGHKTMFTNSIANSPIREILDVVPHSVAKSPNLSNKIAKFKVNYKK